MEAADRQKLFDIRCKAKTGIRLTDEEMKYCKIMWRKYPDEYSDMDREIFEATRPIGAI